MREKPILKSEILHAIEHTNSNAHAARFLQVSISRYKKYALLYGLYESHKNKSGGGLTKKKKLGFIPLEDICNGMHPSYNRALLLIRLVRAGKLELKCKLCNFYECRPTGKGPFTFDYIDGNRNNLALDNLSVICFNCLYLTTGKYVIIGRDLPYAKPIPSASSTHTAPSAIEDVPEEDMTALVSELFNI